MTDPEYIFLDTSLFIYWLENHPAYTPKIDRYLTEGLTNEWRFATSVVSFMEYSVKPEELGRYDLIDSFSNFVADLNCPVLTVTREVAIIAYQLRARYKSMKGMDALQVAVALQNGCQPFVTNDKRLSIVTELQITIIGELPE